MQGVVPLHDSFSIHNRSLVLHTTATCSLTHRRGATSARTHQRLAVPFATRTSLPVPAASCTPAELSCRPSMWWRRCGAGVALGSSAPDGSDPKHLLALPVAWAPGPAGWPTLKLVGRLQSRCHRGVIASVPDPVESQIVTADFIGLDPRCPISCQ